MDTTIMLPDTNAVAIENQSGRADIGYVNVFISWTSADRSIKNHLLNFLTSNNITVKESDSECTGNFKVWSQIASSRCSIFLLILTENTLQSEYVPYEVEVAKQFEDFTNRIIPIVSSLDLYRTNGFGLSEKEISAIVMEGDVLSQAVLNELLKKVKDLLVNRAYPQYMKTIKRPIRISSLIGDWRDNAPMQDTYGNLYIPRDVIDARYEEGTAVRQKPDILIEEGRISFVFGAAGSGKSLYVEQIKHACGNDTLPIVITCSKFATEGKALEALMFEELCSLIKNVPDYTIDNFRTLLNVKRVVLILDGTDEIATETVFNRLVDQVNSYCQTHLKTTIIFTGRRKKDAERILIQGQKPDPYQLVALEHPDIQKLCHKLFQLFGKEQKGEEFYIEATSVLSKDIFTNPLLLSQLAFIYHEREAIPKTEFEILETIDTILLRKEKQLSNETSQYSDMMKELSTLLQCFAKKRYLKQSQGKNPSAETIFEDILQNNYHFVNCASRAEFLVNRLRGRTILVGNDFYHKMFLEYFAAVQFYKESFDLYDDIQNIEIIKELFSHYQDPYWEKLLQFFLFKADSCIDEANTVQLYKTILAQGITDYSLLFNCCHTLPHHRIPATRTIITDILEKSINGTYPAYGPLFWYVPEYNAYEAAICALEHWETPSTLAPALALVRDVCVIFSGRYKSIELCPSVDSVALFSKVGTKLSHTRYALCELFFCGETTVEAEENIYPRCFDLGEMRSFMTSGEGRHTRMNNAFEDELGLYCHDALPMLNGAYIGFLSLPYEPNRARDTLTSASCSRVCGIAFTPTTNTELQYIHFNRASIRVVYVPENIKSVQKDWHIYMPLKQQVTLYSEVLTYWNTKTRTSPNEIPKTTRYILEDYSSWEKIKSLDNSSDEEIPKLHKNFTENVTNPQNDVDTFPYFAEPFSGHNIIFPTEKSNLSSPRSPWYKDTVRMPDLQSKSEIAHADIKTDSFLVYQVPHDMTTITCDKVSNNRDYSDICFHNGVTSIGPRAFCGWSSIKTKLRIPDSVVTIGEFAFYGCSSLLELEIPWNVQKIGDNAFAECSGLRHVRLSVNFRQEISRIFGPKVNRAIFDFFE